MSDYIHHTPGRLRVKVPEIKNRFQDECRVRRILSEMEGIGDVTINSVTGSVVVTYDPILASPRQMLGLLKENGYFNEKRAVTMDTRIDEAVSRAGKHLGKAAAGWLVGKALESSGLSFLAALI